uniref:Uncharacterized protein n=1 Tax=Oryza meridionalis TaxID=40149 RepID=A0A0E0DBI0_9ORYZ
MRSSPRNSRPHGRPISRDYPGKKNSPFSLLPSPGRHRRRSRAAHSGSSDRQITARPHLHSSSLRPSSPPPHPPLPSGSLPLTSSVTALPSSSPSGSPPLPASSPRARRRRGGPIPFSLRGRGVRRTPLLPSVRPPRVTHAHARPATSPSRLYPPSQFDSNRRVRAASDRRLDALSIDLEVGFPEARRGAKEVLGLMEGELFRCLLGNSWVFYAL